MDILKSIAITTTIAALIIANVNGQILQQYVNGSLAQRVDTSPQQTLTLNALNQISKGSEEFSLELLSVNFKILFHYFTVSYVSLFFIICYSAYQKPLQITIMISLYHLFRSGRY